MTKQTEWRKQNKFSRGLDTPWGAIARTREEQQAELDREIGMRLVRHRHNYGLYRIADDRLLATARTRRSLNPMQELLIGTGTACRIMHITRWSPEKRKMIGRSRRQG